MAYVYILSTYDEHGAENVCASLSRDGIVALAEKHYPTKFGEFERAEITRLFAEETDASLCEIGGIDLGDAWGCLQLQVVILDGPPGRTGAYSKP